MINKDSVNGLRQINERFHEQLITKSPKRELQQSIKKMELKHFGGRDSPIAEPS